MCLHRVLAALVLTIGGQGFLPAAAAVSEYLKKPADWFAGKDALRVAANILSYQSAEGGWPKNQDTTSEPYTGDRSKLRPTFDNSATLDELRFLARIYGARKDGQYVTAFLKGLDYILKAQYPTGGWPQFHPPSTKYHRHITFNDNAMVRLMLFLREVFTAERYGFVGADRSKAAKDAFERGIVCILKCQVKVDGRLTAWCAQHDEKDYGPRPGRAYELVSLSGAESAGVVRLLMSLDDPKPEVVTAVEAAVAWFGLAKLSGVRVETKEDKNAPNGHDKAVVSDPTAPPIWARFYDIATNKPIFCDRDGVARQNLADIGYERRNGYAWYGNWPHDLLAQEYPAWKAKWAGRVGKP